MCERIIQTIGRSPFSWKVTEKNSSISKIFYINESYIWIPLEISLAATSWKLCKNSSFEGECPASQSSKGADLSIFLERPVC